LPAHQAYIVGLEILKMVDASATVIPARSRSAASWVKSYVGVFVIFRSLVFDFLLALVESACSSTVLVPAQQVRDTSTVL